MFIILLLALYQLLLTSSHINPWFANVFISYVFRDVWITWGLWWVANPSLMVDFETPHAADPAAQTHPRRSEGAPRTSKKVPSHKQTLSSTEEHPLKWLLLRRPITLLRGP